MLVQCSGVLIPSWMVKGNRNCQNAGQRRREHEIGVVGTMNGAYTWCRSATPTFLCIQSGRKPPLPRDLIVMETGVRDADEGGSASGECMEGPLWLQYG